MEETSSELYTELVEQIVVAQGYDDKDFAADNVLDWLAERDPHGIHTGYIVKRFRASIGDPPEVDWTVEKRMLEKLMPR